jgi:hypothetical protein
MNFIMTSVAGSKYTIALYQPKTCVMMKIVYREPILVLKPNQTEKQYYTEKENEVLDGIFSFFKKLMEFYNNNAAYLLLF